MSQQGYKETLESQTKNGKLIMETPKTESNKEKEKKSLKHIAQHIIPNQSSPDEYI